MKKLLYISVLFLCSCITITKNYYPKEVIKEVTVKDNSNLAPILYDKTCEACSRILNNSNFTLSIYIPHTCKLYSAPLAIITNSLSIGTASISGSLNYCPGCSHKGTVCCVNHNGGICDWNIHTCGK